MAYVLSDTISSTVTYYASATAATNALSTAGSQGISLYNKTTRNEDMILKNEVWDANSLDWIKAHTVAAPPTLFSDDYGLYDKASRIIFDGKEYKQYDMLSFISKQFRIDNSGVHFMRYPPVKPAAEYTATNPRPPFLLPDNFNYNKFMEATVTPGVIMPTLRADATVSNKMQAPRPQVQAPKVYDATDDKYTYKTYIVKCQYYCTATYGANFTPTQLLQTARSYLGGDVAAFELNDAQRNPNRSPQDWYAMMEKRWTDPNLKSQAMMKLNQAKHNDYECMLL